MGREHRHLLLDGLRECHRASASQRTRPTRPTDPGAAATTSVHQQAAHRIGHRVERGAHGCGGQETFPGELVGQLDLEHDTPTELVPQPVRHTLGVRRSYSCVTVGLPPGACGRRPVEDLDREPLGHRHRC
jgi:hypothetical protein